MIGVELAASCKHDEPCRDCFPEYFAEIVPIAIAESYARHFEGDAYHPLGLGIEFRALQKFCDEHDRFRYRPSNLFFVRVNPVTDCSIRCPLLFISRPLGCTAAPTAPPASSALRTKCSRARARSAFGRGAS